MTSADPTHITEIPVPAANIGFYKYNSSKIVSDPATGNLWFSEVQLDINSKAIRSAIARYNPQSNTWTEWALPNGAGQQPIGLTMGPGGNPWFSEFVPNASGGVASSDSVSLDPANLSSSRSRFRPQRAARRPIPTGSRPEQTVDDLVHR